MKWRLPLLGLAAFASLGRRTATGFDIGLLLLHGLFHFFAAFGAKLGTLFPTLVENLLRADQLDEHLLAAIAFAETGADNAQVAAVAVTVTRPNLAEETVHGFA